VTILSLGAGVQSSTLALMASYQELPVPDAAIFADTGWEPKAVYAWLDWLESYLAFPVYRVSRANIHKDLLARKNATDQRFASIPAYTWNGGMSRRQCTREYKIEPIIRKIRELGGGPKAPVEMWIGISQDEIRRMKPNRVKWIINRWPLIERRMNRQDCLRWMREYGFPEPAKSSCIGCPFHDNGYWRRLKERSPKEFAEAVEVDKAIRDIPGFDYEQYLHRSLIPLDEVDLRSEEDMGQGDMFDNECEGVCGMMCRTGLAPSDVLRLIDQTIGHALAQSEQEAK